MGSKCLAGLTGRAAADELVPNARVSALEKLPAAFRGLTAPLVHHSKTPGSTMAPNTAKPSSCMHRGYQISCLPLAER